MNQKAGLNAEAGITDYWGVDISNFRVHVHRDPEPDGFRLVEALPMGETIHALNVPEAELDLTEMFTGLE